MDHSADLHALAQLVASQSTARVLGRALAALEDLVPYDLAAVFELRGEEARMVASAGRLARKVPSRTLPLPQFPALQRALELRRPVALDAHRHEVEGDPYDGVLDLPPGHACMVVPLFAGDRNLGLITLDRAECGAYPSETVELAGMVGQLVSLAMVLAEQTEELDRYRRQLQAENQRLVREVGGADVAVQRIEGLPQLREVAVAARQVAASELPVLIRGETGTGKEVLARAVHAWSRRADRPFVALNCAAIPENLVESELFGHVRGAFSGADAARPGRFATADRGTLFLDEIGELPLAAQAKLLRVLEDGRFEPVGSDRTHRVDVRIVAATHVDLDEAVRRRLFREDLYYRLAVFELRLPPLRERPDDAVAIARAHLAAAGGRRGAWSLGRDAEARIRQAPWPGNVRQLVNALERAMIAVPGGKIGAEALGLAPVQAAVAELPSFRDNEARYFQRVLEHTGGRISGPGGAAELTGLKPTTLRSRLQKLGIK